MTNECLIRILFIYIYIYKTQDPQVDKHLHQLKTFEVFVLVGTKMSWSQNFVPVVNTVIRCVTEEVESEEDSK